MRRTILLLAALALVLAGCSSPANREAMTPQALTISKHFPYSLRVQTNGGSETGGLDSTNIADADLKAAIARRLASATDQIASAEAAAIRQVREQAVSVAVAAAGDVLSKQMTAEAASSSIDDAIAQVEARLH